MRAAPTILAASAALGVGLMVPGPSSARPVRVLSAARIAVEPVVTADGSIRVVVAAVDDEGAPCRGSVRLEVHALDRRDDATGEASSVLDARGRAAFEFPPAGPGALRLDARLSARGDVADARTVVTFQPGAGTRAVRLQAPPVFDLGAPVSEWSADVLDPLREQPIAEADVSLRLDGDEVARARSSPEGRVVFHVAGTRVGSPGLHALEARLESEQGLLASDVHDLLVRGRPDVRASFSSDGSHIEGRVTYAGQGLEGLTLQCVRPQGAVVCSGITTATGGFSIPWESAWEESEGGEIRLRATSSSPWWLPAEQAGLRVPGGHARGWTRVLLAVPALLLAVLLGALRWARPSERAPSRAGGGPRVGPSEAGVRIQTGLPTPGHGRSLVLRAQDVASGRTVPIARWAVADERGRMWPPEPVDGGGARVEMADGPFVTITFHAPGWATRVHTVATPAGAALAITLDVRTWREELFDRFRKRLGRDARDRQPPIPTPREWAARHGDADGWVAAVEQGAYGRDEPDAETVAVAERVREPAPNAPDRR